MLLPRFSIRTTFLITIGFAVLFLLIGFALRHGDWRWAWGIGVAAGTFAVLAVVHAMFYGLVRLLGIAVGTPQQAEKASTGKEASP